MDRPYILFDHRLCETIGEYRNQDLLMQTVFDNRDYLKNLTMLYIDDSETEFYLGFGGDKEIIDWITNLKTLEPRLRVTTGSDSRGLYEFLELRNHTIAFKECNCPLVVLCFSRYYAIIDGIQSPLGGLTKNEALIHASIEQKDRLYGKYAKIRGHAGFSV